MLIIHFAVTEWFLKQEIRKFFFMIHFPLYFVVAFIAYYTLSGWAMALDSAYVYSIFASMGGWMPVLMFIIITGMVLFFAGRAEKKRSRSMKWGK
jgi:hypothetical protein